MTSKTTEAMLREWMRRGVTVREAAAEAGLTVPSLMFQERRFGVRLRRDRQQNNHKKAAIVAGADNTRVKAWSCSPAAIERALAQRGMQ
jgi:hypothetical protein